MNYNYRAHFFQKVHVSGDAIGEEAGYTPATMKSPARMRPEGLVTRFVTQPVTVSAVTAALGTITHRCARLCTIRATASEASENQEAC